MKRKTVKVEDLVEKANKYLAIDGISQDEKRAVDCFINGILHETGNYRGFGYNFEWTGSDENRANEYNRHYYYR